MRAAAPTPRLLASDPAGGRAGADVVGRAERRRRPPRAGVRRDLFMYVDTTSVGRRKDTRVRVQLREDDLDIDARGSRAIVVAEAGDTSARSSSSSDDEAEEEEERAATPGRRRRRRRRRARRFADAPRRRRPRRASWSHLSTGKAKGGAWCHEVRVRLPARLNPGHHLVFSVFGRDPEPGSVTGWGSLGGKIGPEEPLGHAVLPRGRQRDARTGCRARGAPMRGSKRLAGAGGATATDVRRGSPGGSSRRARRPFGTRRSGFLLGNVGRRERRHRKRPRRFFARGAGFAAEVHADGHPRAHEVRGRQGSRASRGSTVNACTRATRGRRAVCVERGGGGGRGARRRQLPAHKARGHTVFEVARQVQSGGASAASGGGQDGGRARGAQGRTARAPSNSSRTSAIMHLLLTLIAAPPPAVPRGWPWTPRWWLPRRRRARRRKPPTAPSPRRRTRRLPRSPAAAAGFPTPTRPRLTSASTPRVFSRNLQGDIRV